MALPFGATLLLLTAKVSVRAATIVNPLMTIVGYRNELVKWMVVIESCPF
jgi:hypothetical protein